METEISKKRAAKKADDKKLLEAKEKLRNENLQLALKEAFQYHREALSMIFKVTLTCFSVFTVLGSGYILLSSVGSSGMPNPEFLKMRPWIAFTGLVSAGFSTFFQWLSIRAYNLSAKYYLKPLRLELGLPEIPDASDMKKRKRFGVLVGVALYAICMIYMAVWLWVLLINHVFSQ